MRLVAMFSCLMLLGCFPNNAKHRTYAKIVEGGMLVSGIVILTVSNTGADCDMSVGLGMPKNDCKQDASLVSGIGLALIIGGLVGFMGTVATTVDDSKGTTIKAADKKADPMVPTAPSTTPTPIAPAITPAPAPPPTAP